MGVWLFSLLDDLSSSSSIKSVLIAFRFGPDNENPIFPWFTVGKCRKQRFTRNFQSRLCSFSPRPNHSFSRPSPSVFHFANLLHQTNTQWAVGTVQAANGQMSVWQVVFRVAIIASPLRSSSKKEDSEIHHCHWTTHLIVLCGHHVSIQKAQIYQRKAQTMATANLGQTLEKISSWNYPPKITYDL